MLLQSQETISSGSGSSTGPSVRIQTDLFKNNCNNMAVGMLLQSQAGAQHTVQQVTSTNINQQGSNVENGNNTNHMERAASKPNERIASC